MTTDFGHRGLAPTFLFSHLAFSGEHGGIAPTSRSSLILKIPIRLWGVSLLVSCIFGRARGHRPYDAFRILHFASYVSRFSNQQLT